MAEQQVRGGQQIREQMKAIIDQVRVSVREARENSRQDRPIVAEAACDSALSMLDFLDEQIEGPLREMLLRRQRAIQEDELPQRMDNLEERIMLIERTLELRTELTE